MFPVGVPSPAIRAKTLTRFLEKDGVFFRCYSPTDPALQRIANSKQLELKWVQRSN
jgi:hypothetical protein